ncbi:MAG: preprotein translocase subunit YajC [Elusimicrobia bacterium RIFOXYA2_FULL_50_26]|nr:MAG: preprotein translocase subunit YajC [Elusimicrobia bacterium RIFOXYA2_FULL_50_26]OGS24709.1 MAG: preprotein translocase subunit YajC [Elusimicrobia bacterium RIFOXYB2_FULL_50_12]
MKRIITSATILTAASSAVFAQAPAQGSSNPLGSFLPLIVIFFIFYFLMIRPQQKKMKEHQKMLNELKKDDRVITSGGIHAVVVALKGNLLEVKIAEGVKIIIDKSAVSAVIPPESQTVTPEIIK